MDDPLVGLARPGGSPEVLYATAASYAQAGAGLAGTAGGVAGVADRLAGSWQGVAGRDAVATVGLLGAGVDQAGQAWSAAGGTLRWYAGVLADAQAQFDAARRLADQALAEEAAQAQAAAAVAAQEAAEGAAASGRSVWGPGGVSGGWVSPLRALARARAVEAVDRAQVGAARAAEELEELVPAAGRQTGPGWGAYAANGYAMLRRVLAVDDAWSAGTHLTRGAVNGWRWWQAHQSSVRAAAQPMGSRVVIVEEVARVTVRMSWQSGPVWGQASVAAVLVRLREGWVDNVTAATHARQAARAAERAKQAFLSSRPIGAGQALRARLRRGVAAVTGPLAARFPTVTADAARTARVLGTVARRGLGVAGLLSSAYETYKAVDEGRNGDAAAEVAGMVGSRLMVAPVPGGRLAGAALVAGSLIYEYHDEIADLGAKALDEVSDFAGDLAGKLNPFD